MWVDNCASQIQADSLRFFFFVFFFVFLFIFVKREKRVHAKPPTPAIRQDNLTAEFGDVEVLLFIECHIIDMFRIK